MRKQYFNYVDPRNMLKALTNTSSRYVSDKPKDGKPVRYGVACRQLSKGSRTSISDTFTRKSEAVALRNKLNNGLGGGPYRVITIGK